MSLNSLTAKNPSGQADVDRTRDARKRFLSQNHVPKTSKYYDEGHGIHEDENGVPYYGMPKSTLESGVIVDRQ